MTPIQKEAELRSLFRQWLNGPGDAALVARLASLADDEEMRNLWLELLDKTDATTSGIAEEGRHAAVIDRVYKNLVRIQPDLEIQKKVRKRYLVPMRYAAAIALFMVLGTIGYVFFRKQQVPAGVVDTHIQNDVPPGRSGAILMLANGQKIMLDSFSTERPVIQNGAAISLKDGLVVYNKDKIVDTGIQYNTMLTPRGQQYQLRLPDGTHVWLNAASSITYPTAFTGTERSVSITGEAYFEVAKNVSMPFKVKVNDASVEVLGTHFNINAYGDDNLIKTTLLEGVVQIVRGEARQMLKPGQQAQFSNDSKTIQLIKEADLDGVIAWKNGVFDFKGQDIETIMNQVSRWYNVDVIYKGGKIQGHFSGVINRNKKLSTVLKILELNNIHFKIENSTTGESAGRIIVQP